MHIDQLPRPNRRKATLKITAFFAVLLMALVALNSPITFASASTANSAVSTLQQSTTTTTSSTVADQAVANVAKAANPGVVTITNLQAIQDPRTGEMTDPQPYASGSGYIIDAAGNLVTNNHVIEGGAAFQVTYADGTTVDAKLVGSDPYQDVAVLKLELKRGEKVPGVVAFGDSSALEAGEQVIAIGTPYGEYNNSVTTGIVNAVNRSLDEGNGFSLPNLIQHDAAIYPGNSGGPLLNLDGQVVGMNVAKATDPSTGSTQDSGIGFAIESNAVKTIVDQIIKTGSFDRAYLGIRSELTLDGQGVVSVEAGGPAATAGLKANDIITAIDGTKVDDSHPFVNQLLFDHKPGDTVKLTVERDNASMTVSVKLGTRPAETQ